MCPAWQPGHAVVAVPQQLDAEAARVRGQEVEPVQYSTVQYSTVQPVSAARRSNLANSELRILTSSPGSHRVDSAVTHGRG